MNLAVLGYHLHFGMQLYKQEAFKMKLNSKTILINFIQKSKLHALAKELFAVIEGVLRGSRILAI
jgi:hypothetical protein